MPNSINAYQCSHCSKKIYKSKSGVVAHESKCPWNTENRACATCRARVVSQKGIQGHPGHYRQIYTCAVYQTDLAEHLDLKIHCLAWGGEQARTVVQIKAKQRVNSARGASFRQSINH